MATPVLGDDDVVDVCPPFTIFGVSGYTITSHFNDIEPKLNAPQIKWASDQAGLPVSHLPTVVGQVRVRPPLT